MPHLLVPIQAWRTRVSSGLLPSRSTKFRNYQQQSPRGNWVMPRTVTFQLLCTFLNPWTLFFYTFHFEIILDLEKSWERVQSSGVPCAQLPVPASCAGTPRRSRAGINTGRTRSATLLAGVRFHQSFLTSPTPVPGPTKDPTALCLLVTFTLLKVRGLSSVSQLECLLFYHDSVEVTYLWQENGRSAVRSLVCLVGRRKPECFDLILLRKVASARFPHWKVTISFVSNKHLGELLKTLQISYFSSNFRPLTLASIGGFCCDDYPCGVLMVTVCLPHSFYI